MNRKIKDLTITALFAAVIFIMTYTFKIPNVMTGGYVHLGDCGIFVAVLLLGRKNGTIAAAVGGALADLLGGYFIFILPTFIIKGLMAYVMGTVLEHLHTEGRWNWLYGAVPGGIVQVLGYGVFEAFMYGIPTALTSAAANAAQTFSGIILAAAVIIVLQTSGMVSRLKQM